MAKDFITRRLADKPDAIAPDGSEVRLLAEICTRLHGAFRTAAGQGFCRRCPSQR